MRLIHSVAVAILLAVSGCSPPDDEAELRELLAAMESAAEARDTGFFRGLIAESYIDASGRRRDEIIDSIRGFFFVNSSVEVVTRVERIEVVADEVAEIGLQAAVIGNSGRGVLGRDADFYTLDLELARTGSDWQVIGASWERPGR